LFVIAQEDVSDSAYAYGDYESDYGYYESDPDDPFRAVCWSLTSVTRENSKKLIQVGKRLYKEYFRSNPAESDSHSVFTYGYDM